MADPLSTAPPRTARGAPGGGGPAAAAADPAAPLLTPTFAVTAGATFAVFCSFYMLLPTIPLYAVHLGATEAQVGLVMGLLTAASTAIRPCVAPWIDRQRRKPFVAAGALIFAVSGALYLFATTVPRLLALRVFHGFGMGIFMTAATTLVADVAPVPRRGEAMGAYGVAINLAMAVAPAAGMAVVNRASFTALFLAATGVAAVAFALAAALPEPARARATPGGASAAAPPSPGASAVPGGAPAHAPARGGVISRAAVFPSAIVMALTTTYGAVLSFLPIWGRAKGLENPGTFFTLYALALLAVRTRSGKLSDRFGRGAVIVPAFGISAAAMAVLAAAGGAWHILAAGVVFGVGMGSVQSSLAAFLTDRAPEAERARAFATYYGSFELGIAVGSIGLGKLLEATSFPAMWLAAGAASLAGGVLYLAGAGRGGAPAPARPGGRGPRAA